MSKLDTIWYVFLGAMFLGAQAWGTTKDVDFWGILIIINMLRLDRKYR